MELRRQGLIAGLIWIMISGIEFFILSSIGYSEEALKAASLTAILNCFFQLFTLKVIKAPVLSFFSVFIVFLYLFHFGQAVTAAFFDHLAFSLPNYISHYMTNKNAAWRSLCVSLFSIGMIYSGGVLFGNPNHYTVKYDRKMRSEAAGYRSYQTCYYMGRALFIIGTPFQVYYDLRRLQAAMLGGYTGARSVESASGVFGVIASFMYVSIPLIYLTIESRKKRKIFLIAMLAYMCVTMLSGNRGHQVVNIVAVLLVVWFASDMKLSPWNVIKWCVIIFVGLVFLNLIFDIRKYGISYMFDHFAASLGAALENNIVVESLHNFGSTIFTPYLVISGYGTTYTPFFGETYLKSIVSVIPDVFHTFAAINNQAVFSRVLETAHAIGGSFIAELYYNFGSGYWIASFLFGAVYVRISDKIMSAVRSGHYRVVCLFLPFMSYSLWWVRDTVGGITRPVVWLLLVYYVIYRSPFISARSKKGPERPEIM